MASGKTTAAVHAVRLLPCSHARSSGLRTHEASTVLGAVDMVVKIGNPLTAGSGQVQIFDACVEVFGDTVPIDGWISVDELRGRRVSELPIHADLLKFAVPRIGFSRIHGIAKLSDEIGGLYQCRLRILRLA